MKWAFLLPLTLTLATATDLPAGRLATEDSPWDYLIVDDEHGVTAEIRHDRYTAKVEQGDGFVSFQLHPKLPWYPTPLMVLRPDGDGWRDVTGHLWSAKAAEDIPPGPAHPAWTPLKVAVTGSGGVKLGKFRYRCLVTSEEGGWRYPRYGYRDAEDGFEILAPADCKLDLTVEHPDVLQGYGQDIRTIRKANAPEVAATAPLGITLTGTVVDDQTGKPEAGAWVFPTVTQPPDYGPDMRRGVQTGEDGSFTLHGIGGDMSAVAMDQAGQREGWLPSTGVIRLSNKDLQVQEPAAGTAQSYTCVIRLSNKDLRGLFRFSIPAPPIKNVYPDTPIRGRIIREDGSDARDWKLMCVTGAQWDIIVYGAAARNATDGSFSIPAGALDPDENGNCLLIATASGSAPVVRKVPADRLRKGTCRVKLPAGHSISATLKTPPDFKGSLNASLQLSDEANRDGEANRPWPLGALFLASQSLTLTPGQPLHFEHVADGIYFLTVRGEGLGTATRKIKISGKDMDAGEIACAQPGSIRGSLHSPVLDLPFAKGWVTAEGGGDRAGFRTDAEGQFHIENLPAGKAKITFTRTWGDTWEESTAEVTVESGKETTVHDSDFSDPN